MKLNFFKNHDCLEKESNKILLTTDFPQSNYRKNLDYSSHQRLFTCHRIPRTKPVNIFSSDLCTVSNESQFSRLFSRLWIFKFLLYITEFSIWYDKQVFSISTAVQIYLYLSKVSCYLCVEIFFLLYNKAKEFHIDL